MECSEIHLFSCCLLASWQLDRALCLHVLRAWTSGPVYKNWSQASDWEIQNTPIFRMQIAWSCSRAPLASHVSGCCIDLTQGWRWRTWLVLSFVSFSNRSCPQLHHICELFLIILDHIICDELVSQWSPAKCSGRRQSVCAGKRQAVGFFVPPNLWSQPFGSWVPFGLIALVWVWNIFLWLESVEMQVRLPWRQTKLCLL